MQLGQNNTKIILLIEDDATILQLYTIKLENSGYTVIQAVNGLDGLKKTEEFTPDLVLLDLRMPIMSGEEFLQKFRKIKHFREIPVVVLTNISRDEAPKTIWHYGVASYFVKAHNTPSDLIDTVNSKLQ